jgi:hypothetical protein
MTLLVLVQKERKECFKDDLKNEGGPWKKSFERASSASQAIPDNSARTRPMHVPSIYGFVYIHQQLAFDLIIR